MVYDVTPGEGVGPLDFGMSKDDVHAVLGKPDKEVRWTPDTDNWTDIYAKDGISIEYDTDGKLSIVEFAGPVSPEYNDEKLLEIEDPEAWLEEQDDDAQIEPPDLMSESLNIAFYCPESGKRTVGIFKPGYYDAPEEGEDE